jgi:two-component system cell cycle response regulator
MYRGGRGDLRICTDPQHEVCADVLRMHALTLRFHGRRLTAWQRVAAAMGAVLIAYAGWQLFRWPAGHRGLIADVFSYIVGLAAVAAAVAASRRCSDRRLRSAWRLLALAFASYVAGDVTWEIYVLAGSKPYPSVADGFYLLFDPLMLWGLLRFSSGRLRVSERVRLGLDLAVVAIGGAMVVIFLVLGPTVVQSGPDQLETAISIAYPVGDMLLLVGLGCAVLRRPVASSTLALGFLAAMLLVFVSADLVYGYITLHGSYQSGDPVDSLYMVAIALFAVAASAQAPDGPANELATTPRLRRASWAPSIAVATGFTVLVIDHNDLSVVIAAVLLGALVSSRQFLAQRDLLAAQRLASHESLHDALTGLPNRRRLIEDLDEVMAAARDDRPRTLTMFDLDGFKSYNDTFGHLAGDQLLARLGQCLSDFVAPHGRAYRLGGDEFCVLLDAMSASSEEITMGAVSALSEAGSGFSIRASYGAVVIPTEANDVSAALHIADTRMYANKNGRRATAIISQTRDVLLRATAEHTAELPEHMIEVGELSRNVARRLGLDAETVELTLRTGELHDVGKIAIPEGILSKPGPLSPTEWAFIHNHTLTGERVLDAAAALQPVARLVRSTHERFDGAGYPDGLSGEQIPLPARIVFACDAFQAMVSDRDYSPPMTEADAREELRRCAGTQFDPGVVIALFAELDERTPESAVSAGPRTPTDRLATLSLR